MPKKNPNPKTSLRFLPFIKSIRSFHLNFSMNTFLQLLLAITLVSGTIFFLTNSKLPPLTNPFKTSEQKDIAATLEKKAEDIPELQEILTSQDQTVRLNAARKLVERVDVENALEILEHSTLPHTGEGHLVVHQIGFYAYKKYGADSILKCKDYFLYACFHGAIIEAASDQGFEGIKKMTDTCKASPVRFFQCVHAAGHSILAIWDYDLKKAVETCDELYAKETDFPEGLTSCHNGAFMENLFGVHDFGTGKEQKRDWLSEDVYFPCNAFDEKYQKGCWLNQAARIYQLNNGDIEKTAELCKAAGNDQYVAWCMDNVARQIHPLTNGDPSKSFELCKKEGPNWYNDCLVINAGSFYSVGGRDEAIFICQNVSPEVKPECYQRVIGQIISDPIDTPQKQKLCQKIEQPFNNQCLSGLASLRN